MIATSLAAAQSISLPGDIEVNVREHLRFITAAHAAGVQVLVFPELSLTGYELPLLQRCLLHPGEERFASAGTTGSGLLRLGADTVAQAICADITHAQHPAQAAAAGASLYLAGVLESEAGYRADAAAMQRYAQQHTMGMLLANHGGPSGGYVPAGRSAFWAPGGALVVAAPGAGSWLVVASKPRTTDHIQWTGEAMRL